MQSQPLIQPWVFFVIPLVMVGIGLLIAFTKRGTVSGTHIGSRRIEIDHAADPTTVFERLITIGHPFRVDDSDASSRRIVLSTNPTFATWGFLYPIEITASGAGSKIAVGISSKFIQFGPLVTKWHNKAREAIVSALGVPAARVA